MVRLLPRVLATLFVMSCCSGIASADMVGVALLTFDEGTSTGTTFDITNLTGVLNAIPPDFPITPQLTITVTSLVATRDDGETIAIDGSDFSEVGSFGDVNCTVAGDASSGGCDFSAYNLVSATLTGTFSPLTGLAGLPPGDTSIYSAFTVTIVPGCGPSTLTAGCDAAIINANTVPEPSTWAVLGIALIALLVRRRFREEPR